MTLICSLVTLRIYTVSPAYANISEKSINAAVYLYPVFEISGLIQKFSFAFYRNTLMSISANDREINGKFITALQLNRELVIWKATRAHLFCCLSSSKLSFLRNAIIQIYLIPGYAAFN